MKFLLAGKWLRLPLLLLLLSLPLLAQAEVIAPANPPRLVNDRAGVLTPQQVDSLENALVNLDNQTSNQIVIVTIPTLNNVPIEDYAVQLFRQWHIGNKKTNNGVLILTAIKDHKIKIEVGYGLEGAIPDVMAKHIITDEMAPNFRNGDYFGGIVRAADALSKAAVGEYNIKRQDTDNGFPIAPVVLIFGIVFMFFLIGFITTHGGRSAPVLYSRRGSGNWRGGGFGGGGFGGGFGGGGFGGGGGGFGGFGGGSSGGGGASGSW